MNRQNGSTITEREHIRQSIADILTTPLGSRVMRREYGSQLPFLVDQPYNDHTRMLCYAATVMALMRWEPRLYIASVHMAAPSLSGQLELTINGTVIDGNSAFDQRIPLQMGSAA